MSRIIDTLAIASDNGPMSDSAWDNWERLRQNPDADPVEVLKAISVFQKYFAAIEKQAVNVARSQGRTWQEIGDALGRSRQAVQQRAASPGWQRVASLVSDSKEPDWETLGRLLDESWATAAEVRHNIGMSPP